MSLAPATRLGPYEICEVIRAGGMGEVYRARDVRLERDVAVKILQASLCCNAQNLRRLEHEARTVGSLNHPNILALYDVGTHDGMFYLVSELVSGDSLRDLLGSGPLAPAAAVDYALQLARGLAAAHDKGIVHRDIKPENVMVTADGRVKILDFGIATLEPRLPAPDGATVSPGPPGDTEAGLIVGTIGYMSPEQVRGLAVDRRSDIFSAGAVLYEMLTGRRAFGGQTAADAISAVLREDPLIPDLAIPLDLQRVVRRALAKSADDRFQTAQELALALEAAGRGDGRPEPSPWAAIAVLPFANLTPEIDTEYFSDGLTEELIHGLTRIEGLRVVAWNSAARLKGREHDIYAIGRQLAVGAVLEGSVRRSGDRLRVTVRLADTANGYFLWSETYDRRLQDVLAIQQEISAAIVGTLLKRLPGLSPSAPRPVNVEAYTWYLKGRYHWNKRTEDGLHASITCFEKAIAADPGSALAHTGLADALCLFAEYGLKTPAECMPAARSAAAKALELDPSLAEAHTPMALIRSQYDWEWGDAERYYRKAIALNPGYATARHWYAIDFLAVVGRVEEASVEIQIAAELDPLSLIIREGVGFLRMLERRFDESLECYRELIELDPTFYKAFTSMGRTYIQMGRYDQGIEMLEKGRTLTGVVPAILGALGQGYALAGRCDEARVLLATLEDLCRARYVPSTCFALIHAGLGENNRALDWLEKGCEGRELPLASLYMHPAYNSLRHEPRFAAVLQRIGFSQAARV